MKNKVINLFGNKAVIQNKGVKYSELLEQFLTPFAKDFADDAYYEDIIEFVIYAWNFGNLKILLPGYDSQAAIRATGDKNVDFKLLDRMIDHKASKFKEYPNFIVDYEIKETSGGPILSVFTQEKEAYLESLLAQNEEKHAEDDFGESYVNRSAIMVKPLQPFLDWATTVDPESEDDDFERNTYLISDNIEDPEAWLKKKYDRIFVPELEFWEADKKKWPQNRNYKMLRQWFKIDISTIVYDLEKQPVSKSE